MLLINPRELAKAGYIKFDLNTGLAGNGKTVCLISDDEKKLLERIREAIAGKPGLHELDITLDGVADAVLANINVLDRRP